MAQLAVTSPKQLVQESALTKAGHVTSQFKDWKIFPPMANPNLEITAAEFERLVRDWIVKQGGELTSLKVTHDVKVEAYDSTYQIDVLAKFQAFAGAELTLLIECKKYRNAVERELVQVLHDKVRSVGAHKGNAVHHNRVSIRSDKVRYSTWYSTGLDNRRSSYL